MKKEIRSSYIILVVDDTPELLDISVRSLKKAGYMVATATNAKECLDSINSIRPDILLLDIILPDMNGKDICLKLKDDQRFSSMPIVLLSSIEVSNNNILDGLEAGAESYIVRPVKEGEFIQRVDIVCRTMIVERNLKTAILEWETTFNGIKDAILVLDSEGNVMRANKNVSLLLSMPENKILGQKCYDLVHFTKSYIADCPFLRMKKSKKRETLSLPIGEKWYELTVDPLFDEKEDIRGAVHFISDITERKQNEELLNIKFNEIEQVNNLMVGRELKMIELKKEINKLLKKAGKKEKYKIHE
jgi:PAS domain S-box-containing protein